MAKVRIVKIGGNIINDPVALESFLSSFAKQEGPMILVHGGGKKATELSKAMKVETRMIGGRRVTDESTLEIVTMVYAGLINKNIVASLQSKGLNALGLTGADGNVIKAHKRIVQDIDYGFAGDIDEVNEQTLDGWIQQGLTPVFSAITHDKKGQLLNTNADTIAASIAKALAQLHEVELIYCFEKKGVLLDVNNDDSVIERINSEGYSQLKEQGVIAEGMLPKMHNCFDALKGGVRRVIIGQAELLANPDMKYTSLVL